MIKYLTFCVNENLRFFLWFRWCVWHKRSWWIYLTKWKLINIKQKMFCVKCMILSLCRYKVWYMYSSASLPSTFLSYLFVLKVFSSFRYLDLFKNTKYSFTFLHGCQGRICIKSVFGRNAFICHWILRDCFVNTCLCKISQ